MCFHIVHIQYPAFIDVCYLQLANQETLTLPGHLVSPLLPTGPWMSNESVNVHWGTLLRLLSEGASVLLSFTFTPFGYSEFSHCHLSRHFWARSMKGFTKVKPNQVKRGILISKKGFSSDGLSYTPNEANRYKDMRGSVAVFEFILNVKYQRNDAVQLWHQLQCTNNLANLYRCHFGTHPASIFCIH